MTTLRANDAMSQESGNVESVESASLEEQISAYLDGELDSEEARALEERVRSDPKTRGMLEGLDRTWSLLDRLDRVDVDEQFTRTTIEMVAIAAAEEVDRWKSAAPRRRRRTLIAAAVGMMGAALGGFLAVAAYWPNPNKQLLQDLPLLKEVDEFHQIDGVDFLRRLYEEGRRASTAPSRTPGDTEFHHLFYEEPSAREAGDEG
jgi:hypothetical protein